MFPFYLSWIIHYPTFLSLYPLVCFIGNSKTVYVLMLMFLICIGQDGAIEGRDLKFPEPGMYQNVEEYEEIHTSEMGYSGSIFSINYGPGGKYWENDMYHFLLEADEGQIVELVFQEPFQIEWSQKCVYDVLIIRDGRYGYSPPLAELCGDQIPPPIRSTDRYMSILLKTDEDVNGVGFMANYSFIDAPKKQNRSVKECHFNVGGSTPRTLGGFDGFIYSAHATKFVREKENGTIDCTWEIRMPEYYKIMIEFQVFNLADVNECLKNRVEVYDLYPYDMKDSLLRKYCSTTAPTLMTIGNRAFIRFYASNDSFGNDFRVLYTAYRDANTNDDATPNGCNQTISFPCAEFMCLDYSLQCNGRKNCWNFEYDELNCIQNTPPHWTEKVDTVLGVTMGIILFVTVLTIVMTCRHSCMRTHEKAKMMALRRKVEKQAVTYMMDNKEGGETYEMTNISDNYNTQYIKLNSGPQCDGYGPHPSLTTPAPSSHMGMRAPPITEYEKIMDGDAAFRDSRAIPLPPTSSPWIYRDAADQLRQINDVQIHV